MKLSNFLKSLSLMVVVMITALTFSGCSSDKDDEPNDSENSGTGSVGMIPYAQLTGTWIIESIKDSETGTVTKINQEVAFGSFSPKQGSNVVSGDGYQFWAESYSDVFTYPNQDPEDDKSVLIGFCKEKNHGLSESLIYELGFSTIVETEDAYVIQTFALTNFKLSSNTLYANDSAYGIMTNGEYKTVSGLITMTKQ